MINVHDLNGFKLSMDSNHDQMYVIQPIAFGVTFLQSPISIDDLVL